MREAEAGAEAQGDVDKRERERERKREILSLLAPTFSVSRVASVYLFFSFFHSA